MLFNSLPKPENQEAAKSHVDFTTFRGSVGCANIAAIVSADSLANVTDGKSGGKTGRIEARVIDCLREAGSTKTSEIADGVGLDLTRTRELLVKLAHDGIVMAEGESRVRRYRLQSS